MADCIGGDRAGSKPALATRKIVSGILANVAGLAKTNILSRRRRRAVALAGRSHFVLQTVA
jgi:hypothetical protein